MNASIQVPFDINGNQTTRKWWNGTSAPNFIFSACLIFQDYNMSSSSIHIRWRDAKTGVTYISTMDLLEDNLLTTDNAGFTNGIFSINGSFTFTKRGTAVFLIRE